MDDSEPQTQTQQQQDNDQDETSRDTASVPSASSESPSRERNDDDDGNNEQCVDALSALQETLLEIVANDGSASEEAVVDLNQNDDDDNDDAHEDDTADTAASSDSSQRRLCHRGSIQGDSVTTTTPAVIPSSNASLVNGDDFIANLTEVELQCPVRRREVPRQDGERNDDMEEEEEEDEDDDIGEDEDLSDVEGADASEPLSPFVAGGVEGEGEDGTDRRTILRELRAWTTREQQRLSRMHQGADEEETREEDEDEAGEGETIEEMPIVQGKSSRSRSSSARCWSSLARAVPI